MTKGSMPLFNNSWSCSLSDKINHLSMIEEDKYFLVRLVTA